MKARISSYPSALLVLLIMQLCWAMMAIGMEAKVDGGVQDDPTVPKAMVMPFYGSGRKTYVILVEPRNETNRGTKGPSFIRGSVKEGENHVAGAFREANEEAGIDAKKAQIAGQPFQEKLGDKSVIVYTMRFDGNTPETSENNRKVLHVPEDKVAAYFSDRPELLDIWTRASKIISPS